MRVSRVKTMFGFFALPIISMGVALVSIPVLINEGGTAAWAAVAIAQGVGATAALFITFGWGTVGPAEVARSKNSDQKHIYWLSVIMRCFLALVALPITAGITVWLAAPEYTVLALIVSTAMAVQGLSPGWFLIGQGRPMKIAAMETGPRAVAQLVSVVAVVATGQLIWYGVILLLMEVAIASTAALMLAGRDVEMGTVGRQVGDAVRRQWPLAMSALIGSGYTRAAVPIVASVAYPSVAVFASIDRVQLLSRTGIRPLISFFQGWVVRGDAPANDRRPAVAAAITVAAGVVLSAGIWLLLPIYGPWIFTDSISISSTQAGLLGIAIVCVSASYSTGLYYLVPKGAIKALSSASIAGSMAGIPMLLFFTQVWGATGAILAICMAEAIVVVWHLGCLIFIKRSTQLILEVPNSFSEPVRE